MKKISVLLVLFLLNGCASRGELMQHYKSPSQTYRDRGQETPIEITGDMDRLAEGGLGGTYTVLSIYFDHEKVINGQLNADETGDVFGKWQEKPVSASCSVRHVSEKWNENKCIVFINNERTVTLTF